MRNPDKILETYTKTKSIDLTAAIHETLTNILVLCLVAAKYPEVYEFFPEDHPYHAKITEIVDNWNNQGVLQGAWANTTKQAVLVAAGYSAALDIKLSPIEEKSKKEKTKRIIEECDLPF